MSRRSQKTMHFICFSVLSRKNPTFNKAAMMTALNLSTIDRKLIKEIGFKHANEMRCGLQMLPVD